MFNIYTELDLLLTELDALESDADCFSSIVASLLNQAVLLSSKTSYKCTFSSKVIRRKQNLIFAMCSSHALMTEVGHYSSFMTVIPVSVLKPPAAAK